MRREVTRYVGLNRLRRWRRHVCRRKGHQVASLYPFRCRRCGLESSVFYWLPEGVDITPPSLRKP